ncbi:winged helix-turn-helix domain-containing protein [Streptomyces sp. NPDC048603]|uniref:winged helix-turn-helix domain-containing protein n=1 Tax=Streptomyces sp. NPDC048603 TaxID=3365577 RepID=UPI00371588C7
MGAASAIWAAPKHGDTAAPQALIALLGRTRATILRVIADHALCTTSELATYAKTSLASASEHASVRRQAGLTTRGRDHKHARHSVSPVGLTLLSTTAAA